MSKFIFPFAINPPLFPQREKVTQKSKKFQISLKISQNLFRFCFCVMLINFLLLIKQVSQFLTKGKLFLDRQRERERDMILILPLLRPSHFGTLYSRGQTTFAHFCSLSLSFSTQMFRIITKKNMLHLQERG